MWVIFIFLAPTQTRVSCSDKPKRFPLFQAPEFEFRSYLSRQARAKTGWHVYEMNEDTPRAPPRADVPVVGTNLQPAEEESSPAHRNWGKEVESAAEAGC